MKIEKNVTVDYSYFDGEGEYDMVLVIFLVAREKEII